MQGSPVSLVVRIPVFHALTRTPATRVRTPDGRSFLLTLTATESLSRWRVQVMCALAACLTAGGRHGEGLRCRPLPPCL